MSIVDPERPEAQAARTRAASRATVFVSLGAHVVVLLAAVVVPLFGTVLLPAPAQRMEAYVKAAAYEAIPAIAVPTPARRTPSSTPAASAAAPAAAAAPTEAPTGIAAGDAPPMPHSAPQGGLGDAGGAVFGHRPTFGTPPPPRAPTSDPMPRTVRVGGKIRAPSKLRHISPVYPQIAVQARVTGTVILEAMIAPSGEVTGVSVLRSVPLLDAAAVDAVKQWRYAPTLLNGTPVSVLLTVTVRFEQ